MNRNEVQQYFHGLLEKEKHMSAGIAAIKTLLKLLEHDKSETVQGLDSNLQAAIDVMRSFDMPVSAVASGCALFLRFITLAKLDFTTNFEECKDIMLHRGEVFLKKLLQARGKVAKQACAFIYDGSIVLTHSNSRAVLQTMIEAARANKRFEVYVTVSSIDNTGEEMRLALEKENVQCTLILDSAVGYVMESVDMVMVGAESVVESGGIINKIGSFTMAVCAQAMKKPFYVLTESFKFSRLYPLNQRDLPNEFKYLSSKLTTDLKKEHPFVDYTPPSYITLLFTDLGILTPSAVSDELIKLYL
ncbi:unnamed protein product [Bemisia tabaci]|uniref:Translation initiation factor eIF2B subunit alpha n=1 Tax=Bemisia tabaci TaxID=7038 RepID=A0A9P0CBR7_BEMTA|nr:PREDICTED: translation initiation factor eIF-2B subunit alpha [Bemisia tabaci]CAH0777558.1 unnamed protein product [Bemisia tabaci]